ncbi:MAG: hypothetical protein OEW08_14840, partial [Gammaproteobacteria bacterium]|nr:hypothetical protein [Gammaproteobacteria bacterium]
MFARALKFEIIFFGGKRTPCLAITARVIKKWVSRYLSATTLSRCCMLRISLKNVEIACKKKYQ